MAQAAQKEQTDMLRTISPVDNSVLVERPLQTFADVDAILTRAKTAQKTWKLVPMAEKQALMLKFMEAMVAKADEIIDQTVIAEKSPALGQHDLAAPAIDKLGDDVLHFGG